MELGEYVTKKYWDEKNHSEIIYKFDSELITEDEYDICVICGIKTPYKSDTKIQDRLGYVEGVGQCCYKHNSCRYY